MAKGDIIQIKIRNESYQTYFDKKVQCNEKEMKELIDDLKAKGIDLRPYIKQKKDNI